MAGNFTINVVVSGGGAGTSGGQGGGGQGSGFTSAVAGVAGINALNAANRPGVVANKSQAEILEGLLRPAKSPYYSKVQISDYNPRNGEVDLIRVGNTMPTVFSDGKVLPSHPFRTYESYNLNDAETIRKKGLFHRKQIWVPGLFKPIAGDPDALSWEQMHGPGFMAKMANSFETGTTYADDFIDGARKHFTTHGKKYGAIASITAVKMIQSSVAITKHQSGDSYANQQLDNTIRMATSIGALTFAAVTNPVIAAGLVINEAFNIFTSRANFEFDRKMERYEITNNMIAAGNASYGRMRGVGV
jgi:hypothetical protein